MVCTQSIVNGRLVKKRLSLPWKYLKHFLRVLHENDPIMFPIPTKVQVDFLKSNARYQILAAASRFGKSMWACIKLAAITVMLSELTGRAIRGWVVAPKYSLAEKEFRWLRLAIITYGIKLKKDHYSKAMMYLELENGSSITALTVGNKNMDNLLGEEVDWIVFGEFPQNSQQEELWDRYARRALMSRLGIAIFPATHKGWSYFKQLYDRGESKEYKWNDYESFGPYSCLQGGGVSLAEFKDAERTLVKEAFEEQWLGLPVLYTGRVFKEFKEDTHVYSEDQEKRILRQAKYRNFHIIIGCDWGFVNQTAIVFIAEIQNKYFVFDEIYKTGLVVNDIISEINLKLEYWGIEHYIAYADHDIRVQKELAQKGFWSQNARKADKARSIMHLRQMMKADLETGVPGFFVAKRCVHLREELSTYHYGETKDEQNPSELPVKLNDHLVDATLYGLWSPRVDLWSLKERETVK